MAGNKELPSHLSTQSAKLSADVSLISRGDVIHPTHVTSHQIGSDIVIGAGSTSSDDQESQVWLEIRSD